MPGPSSSMAAPEDMCVASEDASSSLTTSGISDSSTNATSTAVSSSFCATPTPSILNKQKTSPVWKFFAHFDPVHHPDKKNSRICLVCKDMGVDKCISIGNYYSPAALVNHLHSVHQEQFHKYLLDSKEIEHKKNKVHERTRLWYNVQHCCYEITRERELAEVQEVTGQDGNEAGIGIEEKNNGAVMVGRKSFKISSHLETSLENSSHSINFSTK